MKTLNILLLLILVELDIYGDMINKAENVNAILTYYGHQLFQKTI